MLNRPWPWLRLGQRAVYPWYVLHQTVIIVLVFWLAPLRLGPAWSRRCSWPARSLGCWGITALVRRSRLAAAAVRPEAARQPASAASMSFASFAGASCGA